MNQFEGFLSYYGKGFRQSEHQVKCFASSNKDRELKIGKALTIIFSLGVQLKVERSTTDNSFFVKSIFN